MSITKNHIEEAVQYVFNAQRDDVTFVYCDTYGLIYIGKTCGNPKCVNCKNRENNLLNQDNENNQTNLSSSKNLSINPKEL